MFKFFFDISLVFIIGLLMAYNQLIIYGLKMGKGQLHIVLNTRPIDDCLNDKQFPDSLKSKLLLIKEVRQYAIDSLGLNNSPNYATVYDQQNKPAIWVVTACEPFAFKAKEWKFPIVGIVPYKGFFKKEEAKAQQISLLSEGYDTKLGTTSGWSTLGWFRDPILSNMLYQSEGELADLIIHELTHSSIFMKSDVQRNENLASFVGDVGAKKFLIHKFGIYSKEYITFMNDQHDELMYNEYMLNSMKQLDALYKSFNTGTSIDEKKKLKEKIIINIVLGVSKLNLFNKTKYFKISKRALTCKNAFFMEFVRYDSQRGYFETELSKEKNSDIAAFIKHQKNL
ncbi:MAG: aminopeptidase [Bacteroidetes bacterium]|nr:aminopeptidase [Bacteroidota bacterium]